MPKRRLFLVLMGGMVFVGVFVSVALVFRPAREPEYEGKKLSEWVEVWPVSFHLGTTRRYLLPSKAQNAVHNMGTNAIPCLVQWIRYEPPGWKIRLFSVTQNTFHYTFIDHRMLRAEGASEALKALGPQVEGAIPGLVSLATDLKATDGARRAIAVLSRLQEKFVSANIALMTNSSANVRLRSIKLVVQQYLTGEWPGTSLSPALPVLVQRLTDEDRGVRKAAVYALGQLRLHAQPAIPPLLELLKDTDPRTRNLAAEAIDLIDPTTLDKVGAQ